MLKTFVKTTLKFITDHKAQIFIGAGIIGNTAATIIACKKTLTAKSIIEDHDNRRDFVDQDKEICKREIKIYDVYNDENRDPNTIYQEPCSEEKYEGYKEYLEGGYKKDLAKNYGLTAAKFVKHYALPAALYVTSNILICIGTGILTKQVTGLATSLTAVTAAYADYRDRVKAAIGEEAENRIFTNEQVETKKYKDVDNDGNEIEKEETVIKTDGRYDPYSLLLDRNSYYYNNDINTTLKNLKHLEQQLTEQLMAEGSLTLNDVYKELGYAKTEAGALVGWIYKQDPVEQEKYGDGYVSFGLFDHIDNNGNVSMYPCTLSDQWIDILNSHTSNRQSDTDEYDIWLHFNVDGQITQHMDKRPGKPI